MRERQTGRQTDRQTDRQADRQTDRQTDRDILRAPYFHVHMIPPYKVFLVEREAIVPDQ